MHLQDIFRESFVFLDEKADSFDAVLCRFSAVMAAGTGLGEDIILDALRKREAMQPTYVGSATALPHSHFSGFDGLVAGFLRLRTPLLMETGGRDEEVRYVICVLNGAGQEEMYLSFLSQVAGMIRNSPAFLDAASARGFMESLGASGNKKLVSLRAADLREPLESMSVTGTVGDALDLMKRQQAVFLAVTDASKRVCGVVGIRSLIRAGLPDYILNMPDLSFISEFKPLEQFWAREGELPVEDCMEGAEGYVIPEDTAHLEILFLMGKYNRKSLITVDADSRYTGMITESGILNRMLRP